MMVGLDPLKAGDDGILSRIDPLKGTEIWRARPLDGERFSAIIVSEDHQYDSSPWFFRRYQAARCSHRYPSFATYQRNCVLLGCEVR